MQNKSRSVQKQQWKLTVEVIDLFENQATELHKIVFELSEFLENNCSYDGHTRDAKAIYSISDIIQRSKKITVMQLYKVQWFLRSEKKETLYIHGLERWLIRNEARVEKRYKKNGWKN